MMHKQLSQLFTVDAIIVPMQAKTSYEALHELAEKFSRAYALPTPEVENILCERERLGSTAIGNEIAIPHGRLNVHQTLGVFAVAPLGIDFAAPDQQAVRIFAALIAPLSGDSYVRSLATISSSLADPLLRAKICLAHSSEEILQLL